MRLYTRSQVIVFSVLSGLIVVLIALGLGLIALPRLPRNTAGDTELSAEKENGARGSGETVPMLWQSPKTQTLNLNTAELQPFTENERENIAIYEQLNGAVVNIRTENIVINWFLEPELRDGGGGSGSIIDTRGYVLTNNHVVKDAYKVYLSLAGGAEIEGTVVGTDMENDLAVIKFTPPKGLDLKTVPFGDSSTLKVGQKVLAIGNPFGLERTLTVGIVSGLGRPIKIPDQQNLIIRGMIQTDASINPGNSGGPLLDAAGKMIGINSIINSPSGGSVGVGFAVPVNTAKRVVAELIEHGKVRRGWIDATVVQLFPALVRHAKLPVDTGLLVSRAKKGGQAEKAGIRQGSDPVRYGSSVLYLGGDIITMVDGIKTDTYADLFSALEDNKPGDKVVVEVLRGGKTLSMTVTLTDREELNQ